MPGHTPARTHTFRPMRKSGDSESSPFYRTLSRLLDSPFLLSAGLLQAPSSTVLRQTFVLNRGREKKMHFNRSQWYDGFLNFLCVLLNTKRNFYLRYLIPNRFFSCRTLPKLDFASPRPSLSISPIHRNRPAHFGEFKSLSSSGRYLRFLSQITLKLNSVSLRSKRKRF